MKKRTYEIFLQQSEYNFSGLHSTKETFICIVSNFVPTVDNVRKTISELFPGKKICETWETLKEQIHSENFQLGWFTVRFDCPDDFISQSLVFEELI